MTPTRLVDNSVVTLYDPTTLPPSFVGLELVVLGLGVLTLVHALRAHRQGNRAALLTWLTIAIYGLVMEIVSYNAFDNFAHGQFTVMFYDRQLPLYIIAVYPVLLYTGIATARHAGLPLAAEALAAGVLIVAMDAPFDVTGPVAGWWRWYDNDPNLAYRWLGVPVTSYYWHFSFGAILAALTGWIAARSRRTPPWWLAFVLPVAIIAIGMVAFAPFHLLKSIGVVDGVIVGCVLGAAALVAVVTPRATPRAPADRSGVALWLVFYGFHGAVAAALALADGDSWYRRVGFVAGVALVALVVRHGGPLRAARPGTIAAE
jgi:hypothetical protein